MLRRVFRKPEWLRVPFDGVYFMELEASEDNGRYQQIDLDIYTIYSIQFPTIAGNKCDLQNDVGFNKLKSCTMKQGFNPINKQKIFVSTGKPA